jgi:predicted ribosomally synthesized peptide with nif11-like leader
MTQERLEALRVASADNEQLRSALAEAATDKDLVRVANEYGVELALEDLQPQNRDLSDAELEGVTGGYTFPATDWIYCDNPWTNAYCTLKC